MHIHDDVSAYICVYMHVVYVYMYGSWLYVRIVFTCTMYMYGNMHPVCKCGEYVGVVKYGTSSLCENTIYMYLWEVPR